MKDYKDVWSKGSDNQWIKREEQTHQALLTQFGPI